MLVCRFLDLRDLLLGSTQAILLYLSFLLRKGRRKEAKRTGLFMVGMKGGHLSHWCFQGCFSFFVFLSPTLFFVFVFCNFNLAAKYSCSVLSVTASQSPGLFQCATNTSFFSRFESFCLSVSFTQTLSRSEIGCALVMYQTRTYTVCIYSIHK